MCTMLRFIFLTVMVVACGAASPVRAQFGAREAEDLGLRKLAESGDAEAQFQLGLRLVSGQGVAKAIPVEGASWIMKSAKQDNEKAMHVLASLYEDGLGVEKNPAKFIEWEQKAADKGLADAQFGLAVAYDTGKGVEKDQSVGAEWVAKSAEQGFPPAEAYYAAKLSRGEGVPKDLRTAAMWFLKSAQHDNSFAQRQLAYLYYTGGGVPIDYKRCEAWYRRAAMREDDPWASNDLAWFLSTCPDKAFQNGKEAVSIAKRAIRVLQDEKGEQRHEMVDTMAAALARNGQFTEAVLWQKKCITLLGEDKELGKEDRAKLAKEFDGRLKLYSSQKAYTDEPAKPEGKAAPLAEDNILEDRDGSSQPARPDQKPKKKKGNVT
ncbi:MAG: Sel1 domain protein repeat-containing protein [Verrucomicrobiaceae bacterium]|nr:Sel1 domain protein repeat-containing protein [Verrucomicrobiaceae bacterium]